MNNTSLDYPLEINRMEKRLAYFRTVTSGTKKSRQISPIPVLTQEQKEEINTSLDKYSLLIAKLHRSTLDHAKKQENSMQDDPRLQTWNELKDVERKLNNFFSDIRLCTSLK